MREIRNSVELTNVLERNLYFFMVRLSDAVFDKWYNELVADWYDAYTPKVYERQYAILKSLVQTKVVRLAGSFTFEVYIDTDSMNRFHDGSNGFDGEEIAKIIETKGFKFGDTVRNPSQAYEQTVEWLRANFDTFLKAEFRNSIRKG